MPSVEILIGRSRLDLNLDDDDNDGDDDDGDDDDDEDDDDDDNDGNDDDDDENDDEDDDDHTGGGQRCWRSPSTWDNGSLRKRTNTMGLKIWSFDQRRLYVQLF